jgi:hypothetical protein
MNRFRLQRPSPAMVVALVALFVAMGGVGYAAINLPKNSVGSTQIKANAVNSSKVANHSLLAGDFKTGQLPAGPQGLQGLQGLPGTPGTSGSKGDPGALIVARPRSTAQIDNTNSSPSGIPLAGATWTQPAGELDLAYGRVTHVESGGCGSPAASSNAVLKIEDNGHEIGRASWAALNPVPITQPIDFSSSLFDNGLFDASASRDHSLTATLSTDCTSGTRTIKDVQVDIAGLR